MKKWLLFLIPILFLLMPKNAHAMVTGQLPTEITLYKTGQPFYTTTSPTKMSEQNGFAYYGTATTESVSGVSYKYNNFMLNQNYSSATLGFQVIQSNVVSNNNNVPIVMFDNMPCDVKVSSWSNISGAGWTNIFGVSCPNVKSIYSTFNITVITPSGNANNALQNKNHYAISSGWDVVYHSDISSSIDENTDAIKENGEKQDETNEKLDELNDNLTNSDTSESSDTAGSFFEDFQSDDYGLSDIITMPLTFIQGLSDSTCYSLNLPLPFVDQDVSIPCMTSIYEEYFSTFLTLYQVITTGFISYWVCVNIYGLVKGFKDPENDNVEVMEL